MVRELENRSRLSVLALSPVGFAGGAERSLLDVLAGLTASGDDVILAAPLGGDLETMARDRNLRFTHWDLPESVRQTGRYSGPAQQLASIAGAVASLSGLRSLIRTHRPDVVYSNSVKSHLLSGVLCPLLGVPVVWHIRDFFGGRRLSPVLFGLGRRCATRIIANSRAVAKEWSDRGIPVEVVYNGFRMPAQPAVHRSNGSGVLHLVTASILAPWKGVDRILTACSRLPAGLDWRLTVCGDEAYETAGHSGERQRLEQLAGQLGLTPRVKFTGMVADIGPYLAEADLFLHGSVREEPFGRVVAEAMLAGVPVIGTRGGGVREIVREGTDGLLYPMGDAEALARAIEELAQDRERREAMGVAARQRIQTDFSVEAMTAAVRSVLASCRR